MDTNTAVKPPPLLSHRHHQAATIVKLLPPSSHRTTLLLLSAAASLAATTILASAFLATLSTLHHCHGHGTTIVAVAPPVPLPPQMAAELEVSFSDDLDGSSLRIGVLLTRWNNEHVSNLVEGIKVSRRWAVNLNQGG
jgi:hypothetical protein